MRVRSWAAYLVGLAMLAVTGVPGEAIAKKRVVILPFTGPMGGVAQRGLVGGLRRKVILISHTKFRNAADEVGADEGGEGMVKTCSKIRCDAVIKGAVRAVGRRRYKVVVTVYNGGTGVAMGRRAAAVRGKGRVARAGRAIGAGCLRLVAKGQFVKAAAAPPPTPPPTPPPPTPVARRDTSDIPVFRPKTTGDGEEEEEGVSKRASAGERRDSLVDLSVSMGMAFRRYILESTDPSLNVEPNKYEGGMYPEFTIRADVFPLTLFMRGIGAGLGIGVGYTRHLTISTKRRDNADETVGTSSQELLLDLKWRWIILAKPTSPWVTVVGGFGMRDFNLDRNTILSSFNYRFIRIGLDLGVPLGTQLAAFTAGFDYRPLLGVGNDAVSAFGVKTGGGGLSARAGFSGIYRLSAGGVIYFVNFEYLRFTTDFEGLAAGNFSSRDEYPDRQDPTSGSDRFIRLWIGAGYSY